MDPQETPKIDDTPFVPGAPAINKKADGVHIASLQRTRLVPVTEQGHFQANGDSAAARELNKLLGDLLDEGLTTLATALAYDSGRWNWALIGVKPETFDLPTIPLSEVVSDTSLTTDEKLDASKAKIAAELVTPAAAEKTG